MINAIRSYCTIRNADERLNLGRFQGEDISFADKMKGFDFASSTRLSLGWKMKRIYQ